MIRVLRDNGFSSLSGQRLLEVGCGTGDWLQFAVRLGAIEKDVAGIDLDEGRLTEARRRLPKADLRLGDASSLPWCEATFSLVLQSTVFSSVLADEMVAAMATEMTRVLTRTGVVLSYDLLVGNPRNPHVRGVRLRELKRLFPGFLVKVRRVTLAPPIARALAPKWWAFATLLENLKVFNTHYLAILVPVRQVPESGSEATDRKNMRTPS